jgi:hypothetical protein
MEMFDETSLPAAYFPSAQTPLTRRLLVYFHAAAYTRAASAVKTPCRSSTKMFFSISNDCSANEQLLL